MVWCSVSVSCDSPILCSMHTGTRIDFRRSHFGLRKETIVVAFDVGSATATDCFEAPS